MPAPPCSLLDCHSLYNGLQGPWLTRGSHLGQEQEEEGGGIHLQVAPLVVAHHGAAGGRVVLGVQAVFGTLSVLELLHFIHLWERASRLHTVKGFTAGRGHTQGQSPALRPLSCYLWEPERGKAAPHGGAVWGILPVHTRCGPAQGDFNKRYRATGQAKGFSLCACAQPEL